MAISPSRARRPLVLGRSTRSFRPALESVEGRILLTLFSSVKSGDWTDETVWGQPAGSGLYPHAGDSATIPVGKSVTLSNSIDLGNSPASGTNVLTVLGQLNIASGATLTIRGDVLQSGTSGSNGTIACAGNLVMDGTASGVKYKINCGAEHATSAKLVFTGTAAAPATFTSLGNGSTNAYVSGGGTYIGAGRIEADHTIFTRIGDDVNKLTSSWLTNSSTSSLIIRDCSFVDCGRVSMTVSLPQYANLDVENSTWSGTRGGESVTLNSSQYSGPTGTRVVRNNRFDKLIELYPVSGLTVDDNMMGGGYIIGYMNPASWKNNLIVSVSPGGTSGPLTAVHDYYYDDSTYNPHPFQIGQIAADYTVDGVIFDCPQGSVGDMVVGGTGQTVNHQLTAVNCIVLPNSMGAGPGKFISPSASGYIMTVEHNTVTTTSAQSSNAETGVAEYGETFSGIPGMYASIRSNIAYSPTGKGAILLRHVTGYVSDPLASPSMGDYNAANAPITTTGSGVLAVYGAHGGYGDVASNQSNPVTPMFTSTTGLGAHDIVANPNLLDITRNLATFDTAYLKNTAPAWYSGTTYQVGDIVSTHSPGFYGDAVINFRCVRTHTSDNTATNGQPGAASGWRTDWEFASLYRIRSSAAQYDPNTPQATPRDLYEWVKAGAAPTNPLFKGTAHDGGDIGAVPVVLAPVANPVSVALVQGTSTAVTLSGTDVNNPPGPLTYAVTSSPAHGGLSGTAPNLVYTPNPYYSGSDGFTYSVRNAQGLVSTATVTINVTPEPAPTVTDVLVHHGNFWTSVTSITRTLPWTNIDAVEFVFSADVIVAQSDLTATGINIPSYATNGFSYNSTSHAAIWGLPSALGVDLLTLALDGHSASAVRTPLGTKLNGGSDYGRTLSILPGDANGDGVVDAKDVNEIKNDLMGIYIPTIFDDLDGDGLVNASDYNAVRSRTGKKLPIAPV